MNQAYTCKCYTAVFILARKIVENLIINILRKKFQKGDKKSTELYFNIDHGRLHDFSIIIKNLKGKANDFKVENKAVERLCGLAEKLKNNANDKTHSLYHLVKKRSEIDDLQLAEIIEIIKKLEEKVGIRSS